MPLSLVQSAFSDALTKRTSGSQERKIIELSEIWLRSKNFETVEAVAAIANNTVGMNHNPNALDFEVKAPIEILRNAEQINKIFNFIMVGIASFALIVGGIGIMNIMLASVTERTREIGIRRALGAKRRDITLQFLIETTLISVCGGMVGIGLGAGSALLLPVIVQKISGQNYPTVIAAWSILGSFFISALIGIGFGLYPAIMAARMNPIEALRHE
jgi:putative ABC transport system permease protein